MPDVSGITVQIDDGELRAWIARFMQQSSPDVLQRLLNAIGQDMESRIERRFDSKTDPSGAPWAPLAESTKERYGKADKGKKRGTLLERSGDMRDKLSYQLESDAVLIGSSAVTDKGVGYPTFHEFGTNRMPRRGFLMEDPESGELGEDDQRSILDLIADHFGY